METFLSIITPTKTAYVEWIIIAIAVVLSILATRKMKEVPTGTQNVVETGVSKLWDFFEGVLGKEHTREFFPILATFFIFIMMCNYVSEFPGAGAWYPVPTSILATTLGLGIIAFATVQVCGSKKKGVLGYLKTFIKPVAFMLPLTLLEQFVRPFSLSLRLYGNLYGEEEVTATLFEIFPLFLPWIMNILALMFALIQSMVFTMLLSIFIGEAIEPDEEEQKKEELKKATKEIKEITQIE